VLQTIGGPEKSLDDYTELAMPRQRLRPVDLTNGYAKSPFTHISADRASATWQVHNLARH